MIKAIIFDCFGVLYGGSLFELFNLCAPERLQELKDANKEADYGFISRDEYVRITADCIGRSVQETEDIMKQKRVRNTELVEYLKKLKTKYKVGFLSNVSNNVMDELFPLEERKELFDAVVLSYEVHMLKPLPAIYELIATQLKVLPGECVMIDDIKENCEGAEIAGMRSITHAHNYSTVAELNAMGVKETL